MAEQLADAQRRDEIEKLIRSNDADSLLKHLRSLMDKNVTPEEASRSFDGMTRIIEHLNSISITGEERTRLKILEIDVSFGSYAFEQTFGTKFENSKMDVREFVKQLSRDRDTKVSAAAHATLVGIDAFNLRKEGSEENFFKFIDTCLLYTSDAADE